MSVLLNSTISRSLNKNVFTSIVRYGHHQRGINPDVAKNLEQKLAERNYKDPQLYYKVDIGYAIPKHSSSYASRIDMLKANRQNRELEQLARHKKLLIDIKTARDDWLACGGPKQIQHIAAHYSIFQHLFGDAYFAPIVPLSIKYQVADKLVPVYYGNYLKPIETAVMPEVTWDVKDPKGLWTLVMTNPDGHLTEENKEYVHWFIGNIPGNAINKGETIVNYLQSFPPKGTGYHRHIFVLYKQEKKIDFSKWRNTDKEINLPKRTFSTPEFYRELQDVLTPAGLAFFQADWDKSLKDFYHHKLNMKMPIFEYDFPTPYNKPQTWFPLREAFNLYMDRYRDPKQINKEFLQRKLRDVHPFMPTREPLPYPCAIPFVGYVPTWLKNELYKSRRKLGRINDI